MTFAPVARSLEAALTDWFDRKRGGADTAAARATIATNSSLLAPRGDMLLALLRGRGVTSLAGRRVLDLGCGFGALSVYLAWHGAEVVGIDRDPKPAVVGRAVAAEHGLAVALRQGRMEDVDVAAAAFDAIIMNNTLCYVIDPAARQAVLAGAARAARAGAVLVVRDPNALHPLDHFSKKIPLLPLLPPALAGRVASGLGVTRPPLRLVTPWTLRRAVAEAGWCDARPEASWPARSLRITVPLARYQHLTAVRAASSS